MKSYLSEIYIVVHKFFVKNWKLQLNSLFENIEYHDTEFYVVKKVKRKM